MMKGRCSCFEAWKLPLTVLVALLFMLMLTTGAFAAREPGDVNNDGKVNVVDVMLVMRHALGLDTLDPADLEVADVNGDGAVNVQDVTLIMQIALGVDPEDPGEDTGDEAFSASEFGIDSLGLGRNAKIDDVKAALGEPLGEEHIDDTVFVPLYVMNYEGLELYYAFFEEDGYVFNGFNISSPVVTGPRGIEVGDSVERVIESFLVENRTPNVFKNPDAEDHPYYNELSVELYYIAPGEDDEDPEMGKYGYYHRDEETGDIAGIEYRHFLPQTGFYVELLFYIEDDLVERIEMWVGLL